MSKYSKMKKYSNIYLSGLKHFNPTLNSKDRITQRDQAIKMQQEAFRKKIKDNKNETHNRNKIR